MEYTKQYSKPEIIQFIKDHLSIQPNTQLRTFKEIYLQLKELELYKQIQSHHRDWPDDEILEQTVEYMEYVKSKIPKEEMLLEIKK